MFIDLNSIFDISGAKTAREGLCDFLEWQKGMIPVAKPEVKFRAEAKNEFGRLTLTLDVEYTLLLECDRCAHDIEIPMTNSFTHTVSSKEDDNCIAYDKSGRIELEQILWDDMLSTIPARILCRPDCKGICLNCKKNLNGGPCLCSEPKTVIIED